MDEKTVEASAVNMDLLATDYGIENGISTSGIIDGNGSNINVDHQSTNASHRILYTRSDEFKNEWNCPSIMTMAYPHLFPYGVNGLFNKQQTTSKLSNSKRNKLLLNYCDRRFSIDRTYNLFTLNMLKKIEATTKSRFKYRVETNETMKIVNINQEHLNQAIQSIQNKTIAMPEEVQALMKRITVVTQNVMGSDSDKMLNRKKIQALTMYYGIATIFLTINPADIHSPIFLRFAGEKTDLDNITVRTVTKFFQEQISPGLFQPIPDQILSKISHLLNPNAHLPYASYKHQAMLEK